MVSIGKGFVYLELLFLVEVCGKIRGGFLMPTLLGIMFYKNE